MPANKTVTYTPGARVIIRDEEWIIREVIPTFRSVELVCDGVSDLVRGKEGRFLSELEKNIQVVDPAETVLVLDDSPEFKKSRLYIESVLRTSVPNDNKLYAGPFGAMDIVPYQMIPAIQALKQPRQRILIADAVGLGKTLEAGILVSELIRRGKGRRILVVTQKSMLTQFQKEFWNRFTIPLIRLDSHGILKIRNRIPATHNPFNYYDKTIISMDTLKGDLEYSNYLDKSWWDIIIIDECHNVAQRSSNSKRSALAKRLSHRSDTLIMLSATPHDGNPRSFASLINMLDPTAIGDETSYSREDFWNRDLVIRRFKKDIKTQLRDVFQERQTVNINVTASKQEEAAFDALCSIPFMSKTNRPGELLRVTFEKALFSSYAAAISSVNERLHKIEQNADTESAEEKEGLERYLTVLQNLTPQNYTKYQKLVEYIKKTIKWKPSQKNNRLVIFSERIETLKFLAENLRSDLGLNEDSLKILHGQLSDIDQQSIVEDFGKDSSKLRLLVCSDVASEGLNLHYLCHHLIHFDIPWSLMVFAQRNGRVDRYGQKEKPVITYLVTETSNEKIRGDIRILEILKEKDKQAYENIGDPSVFMKLYDPRLEEDAIISDMVNGLSADEIDAKYEADSEETDLLSLFLSSIEQSDDSSQNTPSTSLMEKAGLRTDNDSPRSDKELVKNHRASIFSIFPNDWEFGKSALLFLKESGILEHLDLHNDTKRFNITAPPEMNTRLEQIPSELRNEHNQFILTPDPEQIKAEVERCRQDETAWPQVHYFWPQHPIFQWINDRLLACFGRHKAPVIILPKLREHQTVFFMTGVIPNIKGQGVILEHMAVHFEGSSFDYIEPITDFIARLSLSQLPNTGKYQNLVTAQSCLEDAVIQARMYMFEKRKSFEIHINKKLNEYISQLDNLKKRQETALQKWKDSTKLPDQIKNARFEEKTREIKTIFDEYYDWIEKTLTTEEKAWIQVVACFIKGDND